jgi:hypothetical protein
MIGQYIEKAQVSVRRQILYNSLIEFGISIKLLTVIKISLNEPYSNVHIDINLFDAFPIQNNLKQSDALSPLLSALL